MGMITWIKEIFNKMFKREIEKKFEADVLLSPVMEVWIERFYAITSGNPPWQDKEDDIESINFAGYINDVTAGLVTLDAKIKMPDTPRGEYLQKQADYVLQVLHDKVSEALGNAGLMFKPNGKNVDYIEPGNFFPTKVDSNGNILACAFRDIVRRGEYIYTRIEWQRFEDDAELEGLYHITNYAYKSTNENDVGEPVKLQSVPEWAHMEDDALLENVQGTLFSYFKNPVPNRLDRTSPLGVPIWHNALKELKDLDIAWGRKSGEVEDSKHVTFLPQSVIRYADQHNTKMPRWAQGVEMGVGVAEDNKIHEHVSTMLTEQRIKDINSILSMLSTKCGFSQGTFTFDEKQGLRTATEIESDDQETIRTIKNIREALTACLKDLFYALNVMADRYTDTPAVDWEQFKEEISIDFKDIVYNFEENKMFAYQLSQNGYMPKSQFLVEFCNRTPDEAKKMIQEAQAEQPQEESLFGEE